MEFLSLSHRHSSMQNIPSSEEQGERAVFAGYIVSSVYLAIAIKAPSKNQCFVYDYIRAHFEGLRSSLRAANLANSVSNDDVNTNIDWHNWKDAPLGAVKYHILKRKLKGRNPVPWINGPIMNLIEKKESTRKKLKHLHQAI